MTSTIVFLRDDRRGAALSGDTYGVGSLLESNYLSRVQNNMMPVLFCDFAA